MSTPKEKVLKRYPSAYLWHWAGGFCIYIGLETVIGGSSHKTARQAWAAAAKQKAGK